MSETVKLVVLKGSGIQLLSRITESETKVTLDRPVRPVVHPDGKFMMQPWLMFANQDKFDIDKSEILVMLNLITDIEKIYLNQTSVLQTPTLTEKNVIQGGKFSK